MISQRAQDEKKNGNKKWTRHGIISWLAAYEIGSEVSCFRRAEILKFISYAMRRLSDWMFCKKNTSKPKQKRILVTTSFGCLAGRKNIQVNGNLANVFLFLPKARTNFFFLLIFFMLTTGRCECRDFPLFVINDTERAKRNKVIGWHV